MNFLAADPTWVQQFFDQLQTAVFAALGVMFILGSAWQAFGKSLYRKIMSWFEKLETRLENIDNNQSTAQTEREADRRAAKEMNNILLGKVDNLSTELKGVAVQVQDHHGALYGQGGVNGLVQRVAFMEGQRSKEEK